MMQRRMIAATALLVTAWCAPGVASGQDSELAGVTIPFERYKLENGLEVILMPDNRVPLVAINVWYHVGGSDEVPGQSGFAHLYEHMFKNSKHLGDRLHYDVLTEAGAVQANATTNTDRTNYYEVLPSHQLEMGLWLESDRMGYFLPGLSQQRLDLQIEVVRNERRQNYESRAYGRERLAVAAALYQPEHPRHYRTIGRHEDIQNATLDGVTAFYQTWYVPANATLAIGGDFEVSRAKALVDKWFGSFPASTKPVHSPVTPRPITHTRRVEVRDPMARLRRIHYAWHSPGAYQPGDVELDLLADMLKATGTGRLYRTLVHDAQLAQRVSAYQWGSGANGEFHVIVDLKSGADQARAEALLAAELDRVMREPVAQTELDRAVIRSESAVIWNLERLTYRVTLLQRYNHYLDDPGSLQRDLQRAREVTPARIQATAARFLAPSRRVEVITIPGHGKPAKSQ